MSHKTASPKESNMKSSQQHFTGHNELPLTISGVFKNNRATFPGKKNPECLIHFPNHFLSFSLQTNASYSPPFEYIMAKIYPELLDYVPYNPLSVSKDQALAWYFSLEYFFMAENTKSYASNSVIMALCERGLLVIFELICS